jgi:hypothetical protein
MRTEPPGFADFWAIWLPIKRRNDGRGEARMTFAKHIKAGADPQDIIDGARWYARQVPAGDQYVPLASTWLNRGVYEDDCLRERAFKERTPAVQNVVPIRAPGKTAFLIEFERKQNA